MRIIPHEYSIDCLLMILKILGLFSKPLRNMIILTALFGSADGSTAFMVKSGSILTSFSLEAPMMMFVLL